MPAWLESYPESQFPIQFRPLNELRDNELYRIYKYPFLERPRQLLLDQDDPERFRTINRDYILVSSPGYTSWQHQAAQRSPHLEIFHSDAVRIPSEEPRDVFHSGKEKDPYAHRWRLQGMDRTSVDKLLYKHFKLSIPLSAESTSNHWIPLVLPTYVEVQLDVWEHRLAMFFDGNVLTSMMTLNERVDKYGQNLMSDVLRERYLKLCRDSWSGDTDAAIQDPVDAASKKVDRNNTSTAAAQHEGDSKHAAHRPQGRKRRAALRQIEIGPSITNLPPERKDQIISKAPASVDGPIFRGRLKRRARRNQNTHNPGAARDVEEKEVAPDSNGTSKLLPKSPPTNHVINENESRWRYNNGEIGVEKTVNKMPVEMVVNFDRSSISARAGDSSAHGTDSEETSMWKNEVPQIRIRPLQEEPDLHQPQHFRIVSYCNRHRGFKPYPEPDFSAEAVEVVEEKESEDYVIHVADLIDEAGFISLKESYPKSFISVINADVSSSLSYHQDEIFGVPPSPPDSARNEYWHKFSVLIYGYESHWDTRHLPYSQGYGTEHSIPSLVYRENRWGFLDVDNLSSDIRQPSWRSSWKFEAMSTGQRCNCGWQEITHDLNTCRYLKKDLVEESDWSYWAKRTPESILGGVIHFAHQPYEVLEHLRESIHPYRFPYADSKDDAETEGGIEILDSDDINDNGIMNSEENATPTSIDEKDQLNKKKIEETAIELQRRQKREEQVKAREQGKALNDEHKRHQDARKIFESAICHFMGLGVTKDIERAMALTKEAAEAGSVDARSIIARLSAVYDVEHSVPEEILEAWLFEASTRGSQIGFRELNQLFPEKSDEVQETRRFAFDITQPKFFNYKDHVEPHFNFGNIVKLLEQIEAWKQQYRHDPEGIGNPPPIGSITAMAQIEGPEDGFPAEYYIFGSLLHLAALFGFESAVSALLDAGFDIDAQNTNPSIRTPLLCALSRGHAGIAKILVQRGASCQPVMTYTDHQSLCQTPSPLHYLVNVENEDDAKFLARLLVKNGADPNYKCDVDTLRFLTPTEIPLIKGKSMTALRCAVINQKAVLVKTLLAQGAKFAYEEYMRLSEVTEAVQPKLQKGCLLLETPCTDLEILEMFFARARIPGLPLEFSQTPLGLLVSEDDGPERRLRPGFEDFDSVKDALQLLLELQPGFEEVLLWSAVRHDHVKIVQYLIEDLDFEINTSWKGLTMLHTAVLYGRKDIFSYLLSKGVDAPALTERHQLTERRQLTCLHLLMLTPRDPETDIGILNLILDCGIEVDAADSVDGLTALHLAVRNQKFELIKHLLRAGANFLNSVDDKLDTLSQGRNGFLEKVANRPRVFTPSLTIIGEVLVQFIQDGFYSSEYVADLLVIYLDSRPHPVTVEDITVDRGNGMTILHLLALVDSPDAKSVPEATYHQPSNSETKQVPPRPILAQISLLQLVLTRINPLLANTNDAHGDTPLHYACAAHQIHNIETLLASNADPFSRNDFGLNCVDVLTWSVFFIGGKTLLYERPRKSWHPEVDLNPNFRGRTLKKQKHEMNGLSLAFDLFQRLGFQVSEGLKRLALAWDLARLRGQDSRLFVRENDDRRQLEIVPVESTRNLDENGDYVSGRREISKRPYVIGNLVGPTKVEEKKREREEKEKDWDHKWVMRDVLDERGFL